MLRIHAVLGLAFTTLIVAQDAFAQPTQQGSRHREEIGVRRPALRRCALRDQIAAKHVVASRASTCVRAFFDDLSSNPAYQPLDLTPDRVFAADELRFTRDPFDALIVSTAQPTGLPPDTRWEHS